MSTEQPQYLIGPIPATFVALLWQHVEHIVGDAIAPNVPMDAQTMRLRLIAGQVGLWVVSDAQDRVVGGALVALTFYPSAAVATVSVPRGASREAWFLELVEEIEQWASGCCGASALAIIGDKDCGAALGSTARCTMTWQRPIAAPHLPAAIEGQQAEARRVH
jgi:hypothetical protein